jgi:hypothetical protein
VLTITEHDPSAGGDAVRQCLTRHKVCDTGGITLVSDL